MLAPCAFSVCMLVQSPISKALQSYISKTSYPTTSSFLQYFAREQPVLFLGGANALCGSFRSTNGLKMVYLKKFVIFLFRLAFVSVLCHFFPPFPFFYLLCLYVFVFS